MDKREATIKKVKNMIKVTTAALSASLIALGVMGVNDYNKSNSYKEKPEVRVEGRATQSIQEENMTDVRLNKLRNIELSTYKKTFEGKEYKFANPEDVLKLSEKTQEVLECYLRECGAGYWANADLEQFWTDDLHYAVTAIAFMESSYRTDVINSAGCGGLTGLNKAEILKTLREQWFVERVWKDKIPDVNCMDQEVDIFDPQTCIELTYHHMGYNLANRLKKDKYFTDVDGQKKCIWDTIEYTEDMQLRLLIASHRFGLGNVINSIYGRPNANGKLIPLTDYVYGKYVEGVYDQMMELQLNYEDDLAY